MSVSAETYIVISLMFAVFAAFAAVGTSVVLGAGFERIRAGLDQVRRQSGFFADAIHKLDQRTQKLDEETTKLKSGLYAMGERVDRTEKTSTFLADHINTIEQRILNGTPSQPTAKPQVRMMSAVHTVAPARARTEQPRVQVQTGWIAKPVREQTLIQTDNRPSMEMSSGMYRDYPQEAPHEADMQDMADDGLADSQDHGGGITTLLSRYFMGESSGGGKGVVYH